MRSVTLVWRRCLLKPGRDVWIDGVSPCVMGRSWRPLLRTGVSARDTSLSARRTYLPRRSGEKEKDLRLLAQAERSDERLISRRVLAVEVPEESAPLSHELHQPALRVVIFAMHPQVVCQLPDAFGQERDLDIGGAGVCGVRLVGNRDFSRLLRREHYALCLSLPFIPSCRV